MLGLIEILNLIDPYIEIANFLIAILIFVVGFKVLVKTRKSLKIAWSYFFVAIWFFALHEFVGVFQEFGIFKIDGLYALTELLFVIMLLFSILAFNELFENILKRKTGAKGKK